MNKRFVYLIFAVSLFANGAFWLGMKNTRAAWDNVPPVPTRSGAINMALGDPQFAYRAVGTFLQNFGDSGGRTVPLHEYDYDRLVDWFFLADSLDPESDYISRIAAYYYGASQDPEDVKKMLGFLEKVGTRNSGRKWLLLAYGMKIARHELKDMDTALHFANLLASLNRPDLPDWTRRAPAIILSAKGEKEAAYDILVNMLKTEAETMHPNEVNFIVHYICEDLLNRREARANPLCRDIVN